MSIMTQTQTTLERPRLDGPGMLSNVRAEKPSLLPPFASSINSPSTGCFNKDANSPSSRSLRIQGVLNLPKMNELGTTCDETHSTPSTECRPSPAGSLTALTLPPLSRQQPMHWMEGIEPSNQGPSTSIYMAGSSQDSLYPKVATPQEMPRKAIEGSSPRYGDQTPLNQQDTSRAMTPPSQIRGSPTTSSSQLTVSPIYQYHSPRDIQTHADLQSSMKSEGMIGSASLDHDNSSYHVMAMNIDNRTVSVPVDVKAGSRMADDKRKRNAGASARFRLRRKEKERETQLTIEHLSAKLRKAEDELKELQLEREYLRLQRDQYFYMLNNRPVYTA